MSQDEASPIAARFRLSGATLIAACYVLLSAAGVVGLSLGSVPLTVDLPNHAARLFVECNQFDPALGRMYTVEYDLIPNLAIDLLNRPFCGLVDPMTFLRATLALTMAGILAVVWALHRFLNRAANAFVLLAPAMTFNLVTSMGYLNYLIGTFLFLLFAWSMLRFEVLSRHKVWAFVLPNVFGALIFLCHIFALALAGVFLFGLRFATEAGRPWHGRAVRAGVLTALSFAVPMLMMLLAERSGFGFHYTLGGKLRAAWSPMLYSSVLIAASLASIWLGLLYWAFREGIVTIHRATRWSLGFLVAFAILLPSEVLDAVDVDSRSLVSIMYLAIAAFGLRAGAGNGKKAQLAAASIALITLLTQLGATIPKTFLFNRQVAELRSALTVVGPGATVLTLADIDATPLVPEQFYWHLPSYATADRRAFNPNEFTGKGMQPLRANPPFECIDPSVGRPLGLIAAQQLLDPAIQSELQKRKNQHLRYAYLWDRRFDYVLYYHFGSGGNPFPKRLRPVETGSFFTIFRTSRPLGQFPCAG